MLSGNSGQHNPYPIRSWVHYMNPFLPVLLLLPFSIPFSSLLYPLSAEFKSLEISNIKGKCNLAAVEHFNLQQCISYSDVRLFTS